MRFDSDTDYEILLWIPSTSSQSTHSTQKQISRTHPSAKIYSPASTRISTLPNQSRFEPVCVCVCVTKSSAYCSCIWLSFSSLSILGSVSDLCSSSIFIPLLFSAIVKLAVLYRRIWQTFFFWRLRSRRYPGYWFEVINALLTILDIISLSFYPALQFRLQTSLTRIFT